MQAMRLGRELMELRWVAHRQSCHECERIEKALEHFRVFLRVSSMFLLLRMGHRGIQFFQMVLCTY